MDIGILMSITMISLASFLTTITITPILIKRLFEKQLVGLDLHRNIIVANAGGISLLIGFITGITLAGLLDVNSKALLMIFIISVLGFTVGLLDDILGLSKRILILSTLFIGLPFLTYKVGYTVITLTPFGPIDIGLLFWPLAVLGVSFISNSVNVYAGFNGLEAGAGLISSFSLAICSLLYNSLESSIVLFILSSSLLAILKYNFYPAKVFIGNSGTYLIGAIIASSIIVGTIKMSGLIACLPYIINFFIRLCDKLRWTVGDMTEKGEIYCNRFYALWCLFMYKKPIGERELVLKCLIFQGVFGSLAIIYAYVANIIL